jgi:hypothetical protein
MSSVFSKLINLAGNITGTLGIANGGTGQTTAQTARNALLPSQTGAVGQYLASDGTDVSWMAFGAVSATDADATLTSASARSRLYTGFTASRAITMPTANVKAGEVWQLANTAAFDMVVKASNGSALTTANSANIDATVQKGFVLLMATQDTPTTPAHWRVLDVHDTGVNTLTLTGCTTSPTATCTYIRRANSVTINIPNTTATSNTTAATLTGLLTRLSPVVAGTRMFVTPISNNSVVAMGLIYISSAGSTTFTLASDGSGTGFTALGSKGTFQGSTLTWDI